MKIVGFETSSWLYECDGKGRARRHKKSSAPGHEGWGEWGHCLYLGRSAELPPLHPGDICGPAEDIVLGYSGTPYKFQSLPFSDTEALARPIDYAHLVVKRTHRESGDVKTFAAGETPRKNWLPIFMGWSEKEEAIVAAVGQPVERLFTDRATLEKILHPPPLAHGGLFLVPRPERREQVAGMDFR